MSKMLSKYIRVYVECMEMKTRMFLPKGCESLIYVSYRIVHALLKPRLSTRHKKILLRKHDE